MTIGPLLRRLRGERGGATVEFVLTFPVFMLVFMSAFEMSLFLVRQSMLERATDLAMREVRLSTGETFAQATLRRTICERAVVLPQCDSSLVIGLTTIDRDTYALPAPGARCAAGGGAVTGAPIIGNAAANDLILVRVCYAARPIFPTTGLGLALAEAEGGRVSMIATSLYVQEPLGDTARSSSR